MGEARAEILRRIRAGVSDQDRDGVPGDAALPEVPRDYARTRPAADPLALLAERVADYRAGVHRVVPADLPARITALLRARGARTMAVPVDVPAEWRVPDVRWLADAPPLQVAELDEVDGVLTGCVVAIAETGTVVLDAGVTQGRRVLTLVPDYHLCVVRAEQVAVSVPEALSRLDPVRPLTFVSGPSATSDIELDRVEGVHGPRTLDVIIVQGPTM